MCSCTGDAYVLAAYAGGAAVVPRAEGRPERDRAQRAGRLTAPAAAAAASRQRPRARARPRLHAAPPTPRGRTRVTPVAP